MSCNEYPDNSDKWLPRDAISAKLIFFILILLFSIKICFQKKSIWSKQYRFINVPERCKGFYVGRRYSTDPANAYLLKVNCSNTRKMFEICSKLTAKTPEQLQWFRSSVFIVNFEHISHLLLGLLLFILNR